MCFSGIVYDWTQLAATGNPLKVIAGTSSVWGYNMFATVSGSETPRIILRLSDVTTVADDAGNKMYNGPQFMTIKGFKGVASIKAGNVYTVGASALKFDETDITPNPNMDTIEVEVTVEVANWVTNAVEPEI